MYIRFVFFIHYYVCFHAQDTGNINIIANVGSIISNKINVEDIYDKILGEINELTRFGNSISIVNSSTFNLGHDSNNKYYTTSTSHNDAFKPTDFDSLTSFKFSGEIYATGNQRIGIGIYQSDLSKGMSVGIGDNMWYNMDIPITAHNKYGDSTNYINTWLYFEIIVKNKIATFNIKTSEKGASLYTYTYNLTSDTALKCGITKGHDAQTSYFKNLKIHKL